MGLKIQIKLHKNQYSFGSSTYTIDSSGSVLTGRAIITDEDKQELMTMSMNMAIRHVAEDISKDMAVFVKKTYAAEIKKEIKAYVDANRDKLMAELMKTVSKDADKALARLYERDNW
jgi:hypothetical protein